jgi:hypothetical protein
MSFQRSGVAGSGSDYWVSHEIRDFPMGPHTLTKVDEFP